MPLMTETHDPRLSVERLTAVLGAELARRARPPAATASHLDDLDTLLRAAEEKAQVRTQLPQQLQRFPFTWSAALQRLVLKLYKFLFQDQRAVNNVLIQALRETLAINRDLLARLEEPDRATGETEDRKAA
jgi:O-antigen chain-terminating methyltransferase